MADAAVLNLCDRGGGVSRRKKFVCWVARKTQDALFDA